MPTCCFECTECSDGEYSDHKGRSFCLLLPVTVHKHSGNPSDVSFRRQHLHQVSKQLLVQWEPHLLLSEGNRVPGLVGTLWDRFGHLRGLGGSLDGICDGSLCQISQHSHREGLEPRTVLRPLVVPHLLFFQLSHLHRGASRLDLPFTPACFWDQFCPLHLLHPGENQQGSFGV